MLLLSGAALIGMLAVDRPPPPQGDVPDLSEQAVSERERSVSPISTDDYSVSVPVDFVPGWVVPPGVGDHQHPNGFPSNLLADGDDAVGGVAVVVDGAASFVIQSDRPGTVAFRILDGDGLPSAWQTMVLGDGEGPDGTPGAEGGDEPRIPASFPTLLKPDDRQLELVAVSPDLVAIDVVFLPAFEVDSQPEFDGPAGPSAGIVPTIIPRSAWAHLDWQYQRGSCDDGPTEADRLQAIVVHHTVTANDYQADQVDDLLRSILYSHTRINGWCDIGYNFVVDRFGRIWEARTGSIEKAIVGGHARGFNTATLGVAMLGQHHPGARPDASRPTGASLDAIESLAVWRLLEAGVDPLGTTWLRNRSSGSGQRLASGEWHMVPTVLGHRNLGFTSCPGSHGMDLVADLRSRLAARMSRTVPLEFDGWQPENHGIAMVVAGSRGGLRPAGSAVPWAAAPAALSEKVVAVGGSVSGGYLLTEGGALVAFGDTPAVGASGVSGAVDLVVRSNGTSGWVLGRSGQLRGFGGAPVPTVSGAATNAVALAIDDSGDGYVVRSDGALVAVGDAGPATVGSLRGAVPIDVALSSLGGGWRLDSLGRLSGFGGRPDASVRLQPEAGRPVALVADRWGSGGWVVDESGRVLPFGGARYITAFSTDVSARNVVDAASLGLAFGPGFKDSPDARYVARLFRTFSGREPSDAELHQAVAALEQGERTDLVESLVQGQAWVGAELDNMYTEVLGRSPDEAGRKYWMNELGSGLKLADLGIYFYGGEEYARAAGSSEGYVRRLYQVLLGRQPDAKGLAYWVGEVESGRAGAPDVAAGFYSSIESLRRRSGRLHSTIVGTPPTSGERDDLARRLAQLGDIGFAVELASDPDFYDLAAAGPEP